MTRIGQQQVGKHAGSADECRRLTRCQPSRVNVAAQSCIGSARSLNSVECKLFAS